MNNNEWDIVTTKILKAVSELPMENHEEEMIKMSIQYMIYKMCESEEIFENNISILDQHAENGFVKKKVIGGGL